MKKQVIKSITKLLSNNYPTYKVIFNNSILPTDKYAEISKVDGYSIVTLVHNVWDIEYLYFNEIK